MGGGDGVVRCFNIVSDMDWIFIKFKISINGKDAYILDLGDVMGVQTFNLPANVSKVFGEVKKVRFTILETYPGLKWKDTAISGIFSCGG